MTKYRQNGEDGINGSNNLTIKCARNEFESFQVLIYADGENLSNVDVSVSDFTKGADKVSDIVIYKQYYVNCSNNSRVEYKTGYYPDALLPKVDRYYGETRNTFPFSVSNGNVQGVWVDVGTESTTNPGTYKGQVTVTAAGKSPIILSINLIVWDFSLPSTATYPALFGYERSYVSYGHGRGLEWGGEWQLNMAKLYNKCALYHRISTKMGGNAPIIYSWDKVSKRLSITDWKNFTAEYEDALDGTLISSGPYSGAKMRVTLIANAWMVDNDPKIAISDKETAERQFLQQWWNKFRDKNWDPWTRLFIPSPKDEPKGTMFSWRGLTLPDYQICSDGADDVNAVNTGGYGIWKNIYVNAHNKPELDEFAKKGFFDPWVGHYAPDGWEKTNASSNYLYPRTGYPGYPNDDMRHWAYLSCMNNKCSGTGNEWYSGQIDWSADAPAIYNRIWSFVWWKYEIKGVLYWGMCQDNYHGEKAPYSSIWYYGSNGDGHLVYPGVASKIGLALPPSTPAIGGEHDIPIGSIRLKHIRDAMEDLEYMVLAKSQKGKYEVDDIVDQMFTNPVMPFAYWNLNKNSRDLNIVRERIANLITQNNAVEAPRNLRIITNGSSPD